MEEVKRITEQTEQSVGGFSTHEAGSYSVEDLDLLLGECRNAMRRLSDIRTVVDDLPTVEERS